MTDTLSLLLATAPTRLDPLTLFLDADIVVQIVMIGLILASVWVWTIIVGFSLRAGGLETRSRDYEKDFWETKDRDSLLTRDMRSEVPSARVASAGLDEWKRSTASGRLVDKTAARERIAAAMDSQIAEEADDLAGKLNFLATTGSVAPFVGLFGTVWGIMNAFLKIGEKQDTSLATVAGPIAEALFATGLGLVAAIPAVIFYNKFSGDLAKFADQLDAFSQDMLVRLSRRTSDDRGA